MMNKDGMVDHPAASRPEIRKAIIMIGKCENPLVRAVRVAPVVAAIAFASSGSIV
jgi:hypothetical protein